MDVAPNSNAKYTVLNTHFGLTQNEKIDGFKTLDALLNESRHFKKPAMVMGDFNTSYEDFTNNINNFSPAYSGDDDTYISWNGFHSGEIDNIFYNNLSPLSIKQAGVVISNGEVNDNGTINQDKRASDHRPVMADFGMPQK